MNIIIGNLIHFKLVFCWNSILKHPNWQNYETRLEYWIEFVATRGS